MTSFLLRPGIYGPFWSAPVRTAPDHLVLTLAGSGPCIPGWSPSALVHDPLGSDMCPWRPEFCTNPPVVVRKGSTCDFKPFAMGDNWRKQKCVKNIFKLNLSRCVNLTGPRLPNGHIKDRPQFLILSVISIVCPCLRPIARETPH